MDRPARSAYVLKLSTPALATARRATSPVAGAVVRRIVATDAEALAQLMLAAYRGTIDDEGEEIDEARDAIGEFFAGTPLWDASTIAVVDGAAAAAVLVTSLDGGPFISYVVTHPDHQRSGLATRIVTAACGQLADAGAEAVSFAITDGNVASEALFSRLGAVRVRS